MSPNPSPANQALLRAILSAYDIAKNDRQLVIDMNVDQIAASLRGPGQKAVFVVAPLSRLVAGHLLRGLPQKAPIALLDWPDSKALGEKIRGLDDAQIDVGLFSVAPLLPAEDLDALALYDQLLAQSRLPEATVAALARVIFESRAELGVEGEFGAAIQPPDTDKDAEILAHPGAAQYVNDDEKSFFDRYGDMIYLGMPVASVVGSVLLFLYSRLARVKPRPAGDLADEVLAVAARVRAAEDFDQLDVADDQLDDILHEALRDIQARHVTAEGLDVFRLAYERTREWIRAKRRAMQGGRRCAEFL